MEDNVLIKIKTYQDVDGDGEEPIELETTGLLGVINGKHYIKYRESEMTGFADTTTTIKVWEGNVCVMRKGKFNMKICYTEGKQQLCLYPTPYGQVAASIKTFDVDFKISENSGHVKVDYTLDADNENFFKNSLNINISPLTPSGKPEKKSKTDGISLRSMAKS